MLDKETNRSIIDYSILLIENGFINNGSNIKRKTIVPSSYLEELIDIINDSENMIEVDPVIAAIFEEENNRFLWENVTLIPLWRHFITEVIFIWKSNMNR